MRWGVKVSSPLPFLLLSKATLALTILLPDIPPFAYEDTETGKPAGILLNQEKRIFHSARIPADFKIVPIPRAMSTVLHSKEYCMGARRQSDKYLYQYVWSKPIAKNEISIYGLSYAHQQLDKLEDIREQSLAVSNGTVVQEILEEKHIHHTAVNGSSTMVSMLKEGRVQLIAISRADYIAAIKANKISNTELYRYFDIGDPYLRIACNRNIEFSTMRRINQAISQMQQAGSLKSLDAFDHP